MIQIIARGNQDDKVNLYVRIFNRGLVNNAIAVGVKLNKVEWEHIDRLLKSAKETREMGGDIVIRDPLAKSLFNIVNRLEKIEADIKFDRKVVKSCIKSILQKEIGKEVEEQEQQVVEVPKTMTLMEWIAEFIRQCEAGERLKQRSTSRVSAGTIKSYKGTLAQLQEYQDKRHKVIDFDDMTLDFYDDWRRFFLSKKVKATGMPYSPNTIGRHVKNLKIFLYAAKDMKLTTTSEFESGRFAADHQDVENVYLTDERIQQLYEVDFEDEKTVERLLSQAPDDKERKYLKDQLTRRMPERLNQAKDIFVVGCLTGQRVSDYKRINASMYRTLSDGREYIYLQQDKTHKWIYIPLDVRVKSILEKYGGYLPKIYDQHLNERIKIVGRLMGWRENAGITELHGALQVQTKKCFYDCIKTHTARRSFATNAYKRRISLSSIMIITGHSSEAMLKKYLKLDNEERAILAAAEFENAKEVKLKIAE